jgi:hypothetical protein
MSSTTNSTSHSSSREGTPEPVKTPLWMSLYVHSIRPPVVNEDTLGSVPSANNPRPLRGMADNADYWVNDAGEAFTFKFPATLDLLGQFDRSGAYFNLPRTGVSVFHVAMMKPRPNSSTSWTSEPSRRCARNSRSIHWTLKEKIFFLVKPLDAVLRPWTC